MSLIRINRDPSRRQLYLFGVLWLLFFGALGWIIHGRGQAWMATGVWCAAVILPVVGVFVPRFMRLLYVGLACLTWPIGIVVSHVILAALYYLILTPIGSLMRLGGYDPMRRRFDRGVSSYWVPREKDANPQSYFRQY